MRKEQEARRVAEDLVRKEQEARRIAEEKARKRAGELFLFLFRR